MTKIRGLNDKAKASLLKSLEDHRQNVKQNIDDATYGPLVTAVCGCGTEILVHASTPADSPVRRICPDCALVEITKAQAEGKTVEVIHRPRVTQHVWRTSDGIDHPVTITQETRMPFNLDTISDAELGAIVRQRMLAQRAEQVQTEAPKAQAKKVKADKKANKKAKKARALDNEREERVTQIMVAFECSDAEAREELAKFEEVMR